MLHISNTSEYPKRKKKKTFLNLGTVAELLCHVSLQWQVLSGQREVLVEQVCLRRAAKQRLTLFQRQLPNRKGETRQCCPAA